MKKDITKRMPKPHPHGFGVTSAFINDEKWARRLWKNPSNAQSLGFISMSIFMLCSFHFFFDVMLNHPWFFIAAVSVLSLFVLIVVSWCTAGLIEKKRKNPTYTAYIKAVREWEILTFVQDFWKVKNREILAFKVQYALKRCLGSIKIQEIVPDHLFFFLYEGIAYYIFVYPSMNEEVNCLILKIFCEDEVRGITPIQNVIIGYAGFTDEARKYAREKGIILVDKRFLIMHLFNKIKKNNDILLKIGYNVKLTPYY